LQIFPDNWESAGHEVLAVARAKFTAYIENVREASVREQLMAIARPLENIQNAILKNVAILEENPLEEDPTFAVMQEILELNRIAEKGLRDRVFVLTVANEDGWKLAGLVAKRKAGIVEDEDYAAAKKELGGGMKKSRDKGKTEADERRGRGWQNQEFSKGARRPRQAFATQMQGFGGSPGAAFVYNQGQPYTFSQGFGQPQWSMFGQPFQSQQAGQGFGMPAFAGSTILSTSSQPPPAATAINRERPKRLCFICSADSHLSAQCPSRQK